MHYVQCRNVAPSDDDGEVIYGGHLDIISLFSISHCFTYALVFSPQNSLTMLGGEDDGPVDISSDELYYLAEEEYNAEFNDPYITFSGSLVPKLDTSMPYSKATLSEGEKEIQNQRYIWPYQRDLVL